MQQNIRIGISWVISRTFIIAAIMVIARILSDSGMSNYAIMLWQNIFAFIFILGYSAYKKHIPPTKKYHLHFARCVFGLSSGLMFFYGISLLPLNTATAITFTGPLFSTLAAIIFLKEKAGKHRIAGLLIGFIGVLIILRPGTEFFNPASVFLLMTAFIWGLTDITIKTLVKTETIHGLLFYMCIIMAVFSVPLAIYHWHTPNIQQALLCALMAACHLANFSTISKAFKHADITVLMPFEFFKLIFVSVFALILFGERLTLPVISGSLVILGASIYVARKERRHETKV